MNLTIVTDHRFYRKGDLIYDDYVFDYKFFETYLTVFTSIKVVARVKKINSIKINWVQSNGPHVSFIDINDIHGFKWLFFSGKHFRRKKAQILDTDCFCFRIPSVASWEIYKLNRNKKPYMFEAIGDPEDAMLSSNISWFKHLFFFLLGKYLKFRNRQLTLNASTGTYVSINHLQKKYPVKKGIFTESVSSIRFRKEDIVQVKSDLTKDLRVIHVGSFIPLKNQMDLVLLTKRFKDNGRFFSLDLVGDGPMKKKCQELVESLGLTGEVRFHGQVTGRAKIMQLLDQANLFIIPSSNEGMPRALLEAMARGLICFGSNKGGIKELLPNEFTFQPGKINQMYRVVDNLFCKSSLDQLYEASSRNIKYASNFSNEILNGKRIRILQHLNSIL